MAIALGVNIKGERRYQRALANARISTNPEIRRRALIRTARLMEPAIRANLRGPAPQRLEVRSGRTIRSVFTDNSRLPNGIAIGLPDRLWWLRRFEEGSNRGHSRRFNPARPIIRPAVDAVLPRLPSIFEAEWRRSIFGRAAR